MKELICRLGLVTVLGLGACGGEAGTEGFAQALNGGNANPGVSPPGSHPRGATYGEWSARWWQWALRQPSDSNPLVDSTGQFCGVDQVEKVWFLAATLEGGTAVRNCTIKTGTMLFFPVANSFCSADGTAAEMQACAAAILDSATDVSADIDGVPIANLTTYRATSPIFDITLPDDNVFGAPPGIYTPSAADGYYLALTPLPPGEHTVHVHARFGTASPTDVTYHLTVAPGQ